MKIELHILQNFAPSNLNRDDTGAPKDCELGGYRRGRISSQCLKRAIRDAFVIHGMFTPEELAVRTKRLVDHVAGCLAEQYERDPSRAVGVTRAALLGAGLGIKNDGATLKTEYLLFLPRGHMERIATVLHEGWDELLPLVAVEDSPPATEAESSGRKKSGRRSGKADKKKSFPKEIGRALTTILADAHSTPDLALFGRMIADAPKWNVEAACQVAHAISTNRFVMDFDFYTAVDDLKPEDTAGSDMMGTVQFASSCFYRYSVLDVEALASNLGGDKELLARTVGAWVRASVLAIPTGKQNSMAAHNPPSFVLGTIRENGPPVSLANAFTEPVRPRNQRDLVTLSIQALTKYLQDLCRMYGTEHLEGLFIADREIEAPEGPATLVDKRNLDGFARAIEDALTTEVPA